MYSAYIKELKIIREHPNANDLKIIEVFYNDVIYNYKKVNFKLGDKIIYFPSDGILDEQFCKDNKLLREDGGYIHDNRRIKAIKLRGHKSDGLILPIEVLSKYVDVDTLKDGDQINVLNGTKICEKYIPGKKKGKPHVQKGKKKKHRVKYPFFNQHVDTNQLRYNLSQFKEGDEVIITEKIHATSGRSGHAIKSTNRHNWLSRLFRIHLKPKKEWEYIMGSRRVNIPIKDVDKKDGFHGGNQFRLNAHKFFEDKLEKGEEVFYEIVGYDDNGNPIMPIVSNKKLKDEEFIKRYGDVTHFKYGLGVGNDVWVYRMIMTNEDGYSIEYSTDQVKWRCEQMGVNFVPILKRFYFTDVDDLMARVEDLVNGPSTIDPTHLREGIVIRLNNRPVFTAYKDKNYEFKVLEGIIKEESSEPDMEEAEEEFNEL